MERLKYEVKLLEKKLRVKDSLVEDSLACTFVACPCHENFKTHNSQIIFNLRKKVMQLRDLRAIQEEEIVSLRSSLKFIKVSSLMDEISQLREALASKGISSLPKHNDAQFEALKRTLNKTATELKQTQVNLLSKERECEQLAINHIKSEGFSHSQKTGLPHFERSVK